MRHVTILGGTDGFGKWLAQYILSDFSDAQITITGRNTEKGTLVAQKMGVVYERDNLRAVENADIVIYCVPIAYMQETIENTLDHLKQGAIILDVTSVKQMPVQSLSRAREDVIVIPTHPMFGPYILSISGQVIVLTPEEKTKKKAEYQLLVGYLKEKKARVIESTPKYHDRMMAVVQGLTHLNMFVIGETMKRLGFDISSSMNFISPIYKIMVSSVGRYLGQNPRLYADIQMYNPEVLEVHEKFLDTAKNFHQSVQEKDIEKFCSDINSARDFLGEESCQAGQAYTDKIIYLLGLQVEKAKNSIGAHISLRDIYSGEVLTGVLEKYEEGYMFLDSGESYSIDFYEVI